MGFRNLMVATATHLTRKHLFRFSFLENWLAACREKTSFPNQRIIFSNCSSWGRTWKVNHLFSWSPGNLKEVNCFWKWMVFWLRNVEGTMLLPKTVVDAKVFGIAMHGDVKGKSCTDEICYLDTTKCYWVDSFLRCKFCCQINVYLFNHAGRNN